LRTTQPPIQCVSGALHMGVRLITHFHLLLRSGMCRVVPHSPNTPSWYCAQVKHRDNLIEDG